MNRVFGIDLGTTNSLIAEIRDGVPHVLRDPITGAALVPSVVALDAQGRTFVGTEAIALEERADADIVVVRSVKRYMGLGADDLDKSDRQRYNFAETSGSVIRFSVGDRSFTPPEISAEILKSLKQRAEAILGGELVQRVVITVPAYFNDAQRQAGGCHRSSTAGRS